MADKDEMDKIQEWQQHQYNPYYWVNKFSPLFPHKRTLGFWILSLIDFFLIIPAFLVFCWLYFSERNNDYLPMVAVLAVFSVVVTLRAIRLRPDFKKSKSQTETDELNRLQNKEKKKKLPKRRKDYG